MVAKNASLQRTTAAMRFGRSTALSQIALCYRFGQLRIAAKRWTQLNYKFTKDFYVVISSNDNNIYSFFCGNF